MRIKCLNKCFQIICQSNYFNTINYLFELNRESKTLKKLASKFYFSVFLLYILNLKLFMIQRV